MCADFSAFETIEIAEGRYDRLELIPWWNQRRLSGAFVIVVGAGALGNELLKNLALLGIGRILVVDMDRIEITNLTRAVLFRDADVGRYKAEAAAERATEINRDVKARPLVGNVITDIGLGLFRRADAVFGGLDNREARLAINQACYRVNRTWIDGAIEAFSGFARVFSPPGACYECTMTETDRKLINKRKSCALLTHEQMLEGKVPTTPTSSSIIAGIQVQEMLKLLHKERNLPTLAGKGYVFNGLTHDSYVVEYQRKEDCMSHDLFDPVREMDWRAAELTLAQLYERARQDLGEGCLVEFDREIATRAACGCGWEKPLYVPLGKLNGEDLVCGTCGGTMRFESVHALDGSEPYLERTLKEFGIPPLHIVSARRGMEYMFYELSGDAAEILGKFE